MGPHRDRVVGRGRAARGAGAALRQQRVAMAAYNPPPFLGACRCATAFATRSSRSRRRSRAPPAVAQGRHQSMLPQPPTARRLPPAARRSPPAAARAPPPSPATLPPLTNRRACIPGTKLHAMVTAVDGSTFLAPRAVHKLQRARSHGGTHPHGSRLASHSIGHSRWVCVPAIRSGLSLLTLHRNATGGV